MSPLRPASCVAVLATVAACTSAGRAAPRRAVAPAPAVDASARADTCSDSARAALGTDTTEARLLAAAGARVVRSGCRLTFRDAAGGAELTLDDVLREGDAWIRHRYRGSVSALGAHLVERSFYEGGGYLLVFPGGAPIAVAGPPLLSPDGTRFATWQMDLEAEYDPNVLQIWRRTPAAARLELALTSEEWGPSAVRWLDAATVAFVQTFSGDDGKKPMERPARLVLRGQRWVIELHTR